MLFSEMDPDGSLFGNRILSRRSCSPLRKPWPWVLKDLSKIKGADELHRVVLVDNNAFSAVLNPDNSLMVRDWNGDDRPDNDLERVSREIDALLSGGSDANYAGRLAAQTPRHEEFRSGLKKLHDLVTSANVAQAAAKDTQQAVLKVWVRTCRVKQRLLGLQSNEY